MSKIERIVLHIGKRKTGSSSIQASLQGFNADGFRYADLPKPNHSRVMLGLIDRLMQREKRRAKDAVPADLDDRRGFRHRQIEEAIGDAPARTVLFSAESLEKVTNEEAASIVDFFARFTVRAAAPILAGFAVPGAAEARLSPGPPALAGLPGNFRAVCPAAWGGSGQDRPLPSGAIRRRVAAQDLSFSARRT